MNTLRNFIFLGHIINFENYINDLENSFYLSHYDYLDYLMFENLDIVKIETYYYVGQFWLLGKNMENGDIWLFSYSMGCSLEIINWGVLWILLAYSRDEGL